MKIAVIVVRILMGLMFLFAVVAYGAIYFKFAPAPELTGTPKLFTEGVNATGYFMPLLKLVELVCALAFLAGRYVALATVVIAPIIVNIFLYHAFVDQAGVIVGVLLVLGNIFLAYAHWDKFKPLLEAK